MKNIAKWSIIAVFAAVAISVVSIAMIIHRCNHPKIEAIPSAFIEATSVWTTESKVDEISIQIDEITLKIVASSSPTVGSSIYYSDDGIERDVFPDELYFGATDIRFHEASGFIYVKVAGRNPVCGPSGERIFEFDARQRARIRDYWVHTN